MGRSSRRSGEIWGDLAGEDLARVQVLDDAQRDKLLLGRLDLVRVRTRVRVRVRVRVRIRG